MFLYGYFYHPCSAEMPRKFRVLTYPEPLRLPRPVVGHLYFLHEYIWIYCIIIVVNLLHVGGIQRLLHVGGLQLLYGINSFIFMCTCWFYSHSEASVHGHEILKTDKSPTGKSYTHLWTNNFICILYFNIHLEHIFKT